MGAQLDAVIAQLQASAAANAAIADKKLLLDNYKAEKQRFADLIDATKLDLDALTTANTTALKNLAAAITAAFP